LKKNWQVLFLAVFLLLAGCGSGSGVPENLLPDSQSEELIVRGTEAFYNLAKANVLKGAQATQQLISLFLTAPEDDAGTQGSFSRVSRTTVYADLSRSNNILQSRLWNVETADAFDLEFTAVFLDENGQTLESRDDNYSSFTLEFNGYSIVDGVRLTFSPGIVSGRRNSVSGELTVELDCRLSSSDGFAFVLGSSGVKLDIWRSLFTGGTIEADYLAENAGMAVSAAIDNDGAGSVQLSEDGIPKGGIVVSDLKRELSFGNADFASDSADLSHPFIGDMLSEKLRSYEGQIDFNGTKRDIAFTLEKKSHVRQICGINARALWFAAPDPTGKVILRADYYAQDKMGNLWYMGTSDGQGEYFPDDCNQLSEELPGSMALWATWQGEDYKSRETNNQIISAVNEDYALADGVDKWHFCGLSKLQKDDTNLSAVPWNHDRKARGAAEEEKYWSPRYGLAALEFRDVFFDRDIGSSSSYNEFSGYIGRTLPAPFLPDISVSSGDGSAVIGWTNTDFSPAEEYAVCYSTATLTDGNGSCISMGNPGSGAKSAVITGLVNGNSYYFQVEARTFLADRTPAATFVSREATLVLSPDAPVNVKARTEPYGICLRWAEVNGAESYRAYYKKSPGVSLADSYVSTGLNELLLDNMGFGDTVYFRLRAENSAGLSPFSTEVSSLLKPAAPVNLRVAGKETPEVSWDKVNGADQYRVYYRKSAEPDFPEDRYVSVSGTEVLTTMVHGLDNGSVYSFMLRAGNSVGFSCNSTEISIITTPSIPLNLWSTAAYRQVTVYWDGVDSASQYQLSHRTANEGEWLDSSWMAGNSLIIDGLSDGIAYEFKVRARHDDGVGLFSDAVSAVTIPGPPSEISAIGQDKQINLSWVEPPGADLYRISSRQSFTETWFYYDLISANSSVQSSASTIFTELKEGTFYEFQLWSANSSGSSTASTIVSTITLPSAPASIFATIMLDTGSVKLNWGLVTGVSNYRVCYRREGTTEWLNRDLVTIDPESLSGSESVSCSESLSCSKSVTCSEFVSGLESFCASEVVSGLEGGFVYEFRVKSNNISGESSGYSLTTSQLTLPAAPEIAGIIGGDRVVDLSWNEARGATEYGISYNKSGWDFEPFHWFSATGNLSLTTGNLVEGKTYEFRLKSRSGIGESTAATVARTVTLPAAARDVTVQEFRDGVLELQWEIVRGASGYRVDYKVESSSEWTEGLWGTANSIIITGLPDYTVYNVRVKSRNISGEGLAYSEVVTAVPLPVVPAVPDSPDLLSGEGLIELNWNMVAGADFYILRYAIGDSGEWQQSTQMTGLSTVISGLDAGVSYSFQLKAGNAGGESEWSSSVSIFTLRVPSLEAIGLDRIVMLNWPDFAGVEGYQLRYRNGLDTSAEWVTEDWFATPPLILSTMVSALSSGVEYDSQLRSRIGTRESAWSETISTFTWPAVPENIYISGGNGAVSLGWEITTALSYAIGYKTTAVTEWSDELISLSNSIEISGLSTGTGYDFRIKTLNSSGESHYSSIVTTITIPAPPIPGVLSRLNRVELFWSPVSGAESFQSSYKTTTATEWTAVDWLSGVQTTAVFLPEYDTEYEFRLRSRNNSGESAWSAVVSTSTGPEIELVSVAAGQVYCHRDSSGFCGNGLPAIVINNDFLLGKYPVTQALWESVMGHWLSTAPNADSGYGDTYPAYYVSWNDIVGENGFLDRLNEAVGCSAILTRAAGTQRYETDSFPEGCYRLPMADEAEYAHRSGSFTDWYWGNIDVSALTAQYAWYQDNNADKVAAVGQKKPNAWGFYDMSGNVREWTFTAGNLDSPPGRICRGGSIMQGSLALKSGLREVCDPDERFFHTGFRVLKTPAENPLLPAPENLQTTAAAGELTLSWGSVSSATGYRAIYRKTPSGSWVYTAWSTSPSITVTGLVHIAETAYEWRVQAGNETGQGSFSAPVSALVPAFDISKEMEMIDIAPGGVSCFDDIGGLCGNGMMNILIDNGFEIGAYPVNQALWEAVTGDRPGDFSVCGADCPVENISWDDIVLGGQDGGPETSFLDLLNDASGCTGLSGTGKERYNPANAALYPNGFPTGCYRLPTADEAEYVQRASSRDMYYWGDSEETAQVSSYVWYDQNSGGLLQLAGQKLPNDFGLYDTAGNVREWVYNYTGLDHFYRGGGYDSPVTDLRSSNRSVAVTAGYRSNNLGFRLLRVPVFNLTAEGGEEQITLNWTAVSGASNYKTAYRSSPAGEWIYSDWSAGTSIIITGLSGDTAYDFQVQADNNEGRFSGVLTSPVTPTGFSAAGGVQQITLVWTEVPEAAYYNVRYRRNGDGSWSETGLFSSTDTLVLTGLVDGMAYDAQIKSKKLSAEGLWSTTAVAFTAPASPTNPVLAGGAEQIELGWDMMPLATEYGLRYRLKGGSWATMSGLTSPPQIFTALENGIEYEFQLFSQNVSGTSAWTTTATTITLPRNPSGLCALRGPERVSLSWQTVTGAAEYNIYYSSSEPVTGGDSFVTVLKNYGIVSGLSGGESYYFAVTARSYTGESGLSETTSSLAGLSALSENIINATSVEMVLVLSGTVNCISGNCGNGNPAITVDHDFYMGVFPVTQGLWTELTGYNPASFSSCGADCPVEMVSWKDIVTGGQTDGPVQSFLDRLNELAGCIDLTGSGPERYDPAGFPAGCYRLPAANESEYAHRAGTGTLYYWGDSEAAAQVSSYAWYVDNSGNSVHGVGQKLPNNWDLYDMSGNVREWTGTENGSDYVLRGGAWNSPVNELRSASRSSQSSDYRSSDIGFRLLRTASLPLNLQLGGGVGEISLGWETFSGASSYRVGYTTYGSGEWTYTTSSSENFIVINDLISDKEYSLRVQALDAEAANIGFSEVVTTRLYHSVQVGETELKLLRIGGGQVDCTTGNCGNGGSRISVDNDFYIGRVPVTQALWEQVTGSNAAWFSACGPDCPVEMVSWDDIVMENGFLDKLNGLTDCTGLIQGAGAVRYAPGSVPSGCFRLPTANEAEYAHRAGTGTLYYWGDSEEPAQVSSYVWYVDNSENSTHVTGLKLPNPWGLYDMSGNVWEWTYDVADVSLRVTRGGSWVANITAMRSNNRYSTWPDARRSYIGFRLLLEATP
jgi:formylglycine-generating enzyme required for sulfatase activity